MDRMMVARELLAVAKRIMARDERGRKAKAEIDFQAIARQIESIVDDIDSHMNVYQKDYDRGVASRIDKATRELISARKAFEETEAYDEDPLG